MNDPDLESIDHPDPPPIETQTPFWSPWATVGWGVLIAVGFILVQGVVTLAWASITSRGGEWTAESLMDGDLLAVATIASTVICVPLVFAVAAARRGCRPARALALSAPRPAELGRWMAVTAGFIVVLDAVTLSLGRPVVPEFMTKVVATADRPLVLWVAIIIAAPLFEELYVRGLLLEGLRRGPLGDAGAIVLTSVVWTSIHIQYDLYELGSVIIFGLLLGLARVLGGSLWIPIAMHAFANLVGTVEAAILAAR